MPYRSRISKKSFTQLETTIVDAGYVPDPHGDFYVLGSSKEVGHYLAPRRTRLGDCRFDTGLWVPAISRMIDKVPTLGHLPIGWAQGMLKELHPESGNMMALFIRLPKPPKPDPVSASRLAKALERHLSLCAELSTVEALARRYEDDPFWRLEYDSVVTPTSQYGPVGLAGLHLLRGESDQALKLLRQVIAAEEASHFFKSSARHILKNLSLTDS